MALRSRSGCSLFTPPGKTLAIPPKLGITEAVPAIPKLDPPPTVGNLVVLMIDETNAICAFQVKVTNKTSKKIKVNIREEVY